MSHCEPISIESKCLVCQNNSLLGEEFFGIEDVPDDFLNGSIKIVVYKQHYSMVYLTLEHFHLLICIIAEKYSLSGYITHILFNLLFNTLAVS